MAPSQSPAIVLVMFPRAEMKRKVTCIIWSRESPSCGSANGKLGLRLDWGHGLPHRRGRGHPSGELHHLLLLLVLVLFIHVVFLTME